ncbi:MAG: MMPL family transporter [Desulfobulbaceae bacterium]|nr:MMPL family transporter [Desulfobulbaceae bacterium]HIJ78638.1 MMPL family transporter [Deltaproteobacteria bacterium]
MKVSGKLVQFSINKPKLVTTVMVVVTLLLGALISMVQVDTDPENMLNEHEAVRVFHHLTKKDFNLYDVVVLGVVNEKNPDGVFNPATLKRVQELTEFSRTLADPNQPEKRVVSRNIIAPGTVDNIEQAGLGQVRFEWLMKEAPTTREGALKIRDNAMANPLLKGTLVSEDGMALCIYLPVTSKDFAYQVRERLLEKIKEFDGEEQFYITGLPVAEDTFGVEMFYQMALSAPLAMLAIFLLMLLFFKKLKMIISPMIVAMVTVICTMGLLIGTGHTLHIMSSMIPIFLMPIAVVDSIHILSEFFDAYQRIGDRRKTLEHVMDHLFMPMLYTSLTSSAGFLSLTLTPIPPVQTFGLFVAVGIMLAWALTILFVPAYVMLLKKESLADFGIRKNKETPSDQAVAKHLDWLKHFTFNHCKLVLTLTVLVILVAGYGISLIRINDNPVNWFTKNHPIRVADQVLNKHFGGTYEAYLVLESAEQELDVTAIADRLVTSINNNAFAEDQQKVSRAALGLLAEVKDSATSPEQFYSQLAQQWEASQDTANDADYETWAQLLDTLSAAKNRGQIFKQPEVLNYIASLQAHIQKTGVVGKSNSVSDVVKKVHQELFAADPQHYRIPDTANGVAQCLISFQNSHKPEDLFHLITPDYTKANIWVQLRSGDNMDMEEVIKDVERFFSEEPPPIAIKHNWAGLTYINVVWQDKMVTGMLESFLSSFVVVYIMMAILFRSPLWGLLAMGPLTVTIAMIYGIIGLVGKDYDMPVAVLSSLTLGLAVDFAIHFLERSRNAYQRAGSWRKALDEMFAEPAQAITRNVVVIAVGFTPLLAAPLVPYKTVGIFLASIMAVSGVATMFILPALITQFENILFKTKQQ